MRAAAPQCGWCGAARDWIGRRELTAIACVVRDGDCPVQSSVAALTGLPAAPDVDEQRTALAQHLPHRLALPLQLL